MKDHKKNIRLVSSDLNGTLVHQHTMMDMIRFAFPDKPDHYEQAKTAFNSQTSGTLSMAQAFNIAGPMTKGLSLRFAIEYALSEMRFINGFDYFIKTLWENRIYFVINSSGYSITIEVIRHIYGPEKFFDIICNRLIFEYKGKPLSEKELADFIKDFLEGGKDKPVYDEIHAAGLVELGIKDEGEKASKVFEIADKIGIPRNALAHIGDTMGDSAGICEVAANGGLGIAFNYNEALKKHVEKFQHDQKIAGKIILIDPKGENSDLRRVLDEIL